MRGLTLMVAVAVAAACSMAEAGPFRRSVTRTTASTCVNGECSTASTKVVSRGGAQQHAEAMASAGSLTHASSHPGYEGIGVGPTPESALRSCCNNGGAVVDEGVAQGRGGRWFACRRYTN